MLNTNRGREYPITVIQKANAQKCIQIHASDITWRTMMCDIDSVYYAYIFVSYKKYLRTYLMDYVSIYRNGACHTWRGHGPLPYNKGNSNFATRHSFEAKIFMTKLELPGAANSRPESSCNARGFVGLSYMIDISIRCRRADKGRVG